MRTSLFCHATGVMTRGGFFIVPPMKKEVNLALSFLILSCFLSYQVYAEAEVSLFKNYDVVLASSQEPMGDKVPPSARQQQADLRGYIQTVTRPDAENKKAGWWGTIFVKGTGEGGAAYDAASVSISDETEVLNQDAKELAPGKADDLKVGLMVDVYFTGPVAFSYPVQVKARKIVIIKASP
jgi:hypothetical protein